VGVGAAGGEDGLLLRLAAAFVRGQREATVTLGAALRGRLDGLGAEDLASVVQAGRAAGLRLHRFKRTQGLARVQRVLGLLRGVAPSDLLDLGCGRGVFLWPLLEAFPGLSVTAVDRERRHAGVVQAVAAGGVEPLTAARAEVDALPFPGRAFDVVTMLEVLEHLREPAPALAEACRVARGFVVLSVPSHDDDNPQHLHRYTRDELAGLLGAAGARRVTFDGVHNHTLAVARVGA
jgi:2-polyprenyl-3-methyl-5-hydroxy-6-metoxy-1,4-benzoquinol methylase